MKAIIKRGKPHARGTHLFLRWARNVFLVMGVSILGYCGYVLIGTNLYQAAQNRFFQQQLSDSRRAGSGNTGVHEVAFHPSVANALGEIEIPRIGVTAMIVEGIDSRTLRRAVGHIPGTPLPGQRGNVGIAGHRDTFFRALRKVRPDDEINLMTYDGSYHYRVTSTQIVEPEATEVLNKSEGDILTLVTCYPFYFVGPAPQRFIVRAERIPE